MDLAVLEKLILLCKKHGVTSCKAEEFEFHLPPQAGAGPVRKDMEEIAKALAAGTATAEDLLFASAPAFMSQEDVMQKLKEMRGE